MSSLNVYTCTHIFTYIVTCIPKSTKLLIKIHHNLVAPTSGEESGVRGQAVLGRLQYVIFPKCIHLCATCTIFESIKRDHFSKILFPLPWKFPRSSR